MQFFILAAFILCQIPDEDPIAEMRRINNYGVDSNRLERGQHEHYFLNGSLVSRQTAISAVTGIPDDSKLLRLTVIGPKEAREVVVNDFKNNPMFSQYRDKVVVQDYSPDHWAVQKVGFYTQGSPVIYLQAPNGKVLHRQDDYVGGPEGLFTALRKADPNYRREGDPDLRGGENPLVLVAVILIVGCVFILIRKDNSND